MGKSWCCRFYVEEEIEYLIFFNDSDVNIRCNGKITFVRDDVLIHSETVEECEE